MEKKCHVENRFLLIIGVADTIQTLEIPETASTDRNIQRSGSYRDGLLTGRWRSAMYQHLLNAAWTFGTGTAPVNPRFSRHSALPSCAAFGLDALHCQS